MVCLREKREDHEQPERAHDDDADAVQQRRSPHEAKRRGEKRRVVLASYSMSAEDALH